MSVVKMKRYAAYKESGVEWIGQVPEHWLICRLKDKATFNPSKSELKKFSGDCTFAPMEKLKTDLLLTDTTTNTSDISGSYTYFREGDILIAKVTPCFENRNIAIAKNLTNGVGFGSSEINVVRVSKKTNQRWFFYLFLSSSFIETGASKMAGAGGLKRIPSLFLDTFAFAIPPLPEQTAIAAYLDEKTARIDRKIDLLGQKAAQFGKLKQSLINETVTRGLDKSVAMKESGVEWIGEVPEHWEVRRAKDIFKKHNRNCFEHDEIVTAFRDGQVTLRLNRRISGFTNAIKEHGYQRIHSGDLVIHAMDAFAGAIGVSDATGKSSPVYSAYTALNKQEIFLPYFGRLLREMALSGFISSLGKGIRERSTEFRHREFSPLAVVIPPLPEQAAIAAYLDEKTAAIDRIVATINSQIEKLKELRKALINDVVTGKIKVVSEEQAV